MRPDALRAAPAVRAGRRRVEQATGPYERIIRQVATGRLSAEELDEVVRLWSGVLRGLGRDWLADALSRSFASDPEAGEGTGGAPAAS